MSRATKIRIFLWKIKRIIKTCVTQIIYPDLILGRGLKVEGYIPIIFIEGKMQIGENLYLRAPTQKIEITVGPGAMLTVGQNALINNGVSIRSLKRITIGDNCKIGDSTAIYDTNFHEIEMGNPRLDTEVLIDNNVWIGRNVVILPGSSIGKNSVIGANSLVNSNIPANVIAAGIPARIIRPLNAPDGYIRR